MSIILNEAALTALLQSTDGPVGQALDRTAQIITGNYEYVRNVIFENVTDGSIWPAVDYLVYNGDNGLQADIGLPEAGRITEYLGDKLAHREQENWVPTLMQNWDSQI